MSTETRDKADHAEAPAGRMGTATCPRCKGYADAEIGAPWERHDGTWEWVKVLPHLHRNTYNSTCRPKGYARRVTHPAVGQP